VAECPELGVSSFGSSTDESIEALVDAIGARFMTLAQEGLLDEEIKSLRSRGVEIVEQPSVEHDLKVTLHPGEVATPRLIPVPALAGAAGVA
jgi:hypothetical protein